MLIAGCQGQVAQALMELAPARPEITALAVGRPALDLCRPASVHSALSSAEPDVMINTAAYTEVDRAEAEPEAAFALNAEGARIFAEIAARRGVPVIHLSTDYVFDGLKQAPYREEDEPAPKSVYGRSKLAGEQAVAAANPRHVILRTSWIHGPHGTNFVKTMLARARKEASLDVVEDQVGCPTYAPHLAAAILDIAARITAEKDAARWGVYHAAGGGAASWFDLAKAALELSARLGGPSAEVRPTRAAAYPTPAPRLADARLDCGKLDEVFGVRLPHWSAGLEACVARLLASETQ